MDERILALLETFMEIERELGREVYEGAVERARLAVAAEVLVEAERRAIRKARTPLQSFQGKVLAFPTRNHRARADGDA